MSFILSFKNSFIFQLYLNKFVLLAYSSPFRASFQLIGQPLLCHYLINLNLLTKNQKVVGQKFDFFAARTFVHSSFCPAPNTVVLTSTVALAILHLLIWTSYHKFRLRNLDINYLTVRPLATLPYLHKNCKEQSCKLYL